VTNKQISIGIEVKNENGELIGLFDWKTFYNNSWKLFYFSKVLYLRKIISTAKSTKSSIKKERSVINYRLRYEILKRDKFKCVSCGKSASETEIEVDHIIPVSLGGKSTKDNLQSLCFKCNKGKSNVY
jgi:hypothetical protein